MVLVIGNKRYSSWSLRPWVAMKHFGIPFEERLVPLDTPQTHAEILKFSPSGRVPALIVDGQVIWDSMAILEYLNETFPEKQMWPAGKQARALARSVANEMHSSFEDMREHMSHDIQTVHETFDHGRAKGDIARVKQIWTECLAKSGGPYLFGEFSIADAMYAPVVNRFITYAVPLEGAVAKYVETMRKNRAHAEWIDAAMKEDLRMPRYEAKK